MSGKVRLVPDYKEDLATAKSERKFVFLDFFNPQRHTGFSMSDIPAATGRSEPVPLGCFPDFGCMIRLPLRKSVEMI
jgi:hypothetical protein